MITIYTYTEARKILRESGTKIVTTLIDGGDWVVIEKIDYLKSLQGKKVPRDNQNQQTTLAYDKENKVLYHFQGIH